MKEKNYIILFHLCFWIINYLYGLLFWDEVSTNSRLFLILPFYINYFFLVPYFFRKGTVLALAIWFLIIWVSMTGIHAIYYYSYCYLNDCIKELEETRTSWIGGYICFYFIAISTGSRLTVDWIRNKRIAQALLLKKTTTQIQSIRTNVNIPFVLETLDSIELNAKKAPDSVQKPIVALSNIMRYGLYESNDEQIALQKEIDIINDYFALINQNQGVYSLMLQVIGDAERIVVPPTILVKFISMWKELYQHNLKGNFTIRILKFEKSLTLILPLIGSSESFLAEVNKKLDLTNQGHFIINCAIINDSIELTITNFKNEN